MGPDFDRKTKDVLAKRAALECSNPSCGSLTVGPNSEADKVTSNGEAAHIYGARQNSARFVAIMTDAARCEITNGIWLCSNCHKLIDSDPMLYPAELLFKWREQHETLVAIRLRGQEAEARLEVEDRSLAKFDKYSPIVRRILIDKPIGWEWRLTAELLRDLNDQELRRLVDLQRGLYTKQLIHLDDASVLTWYSQKCDESIALIAPLSPLLDQLMTAWGEPGEEGDANEIRHICELLNGCLSRMVDFEEHVRFTQVSKRAQPLATLLQNVLGRSLTQFEVLPTKLDEIAALAVERSETLDQKPLIIKHTITFDLPENWNTQVKREMQRFVRSQAPQNDDDTSAGSGCVSFVFALIIALALIGMCS